MSASICGSSRRARPQGRRPAIARPALSSSPARARHRRRTGFRRDRRAHVALRGQALVGLCAGRHRLVGDGRDADSNSRVCSAPGARQAARRGSSRPTGSARRPAARAPIRAMSPTSCPRREPADSLLVVEVITPGGHTSSYPPHKHDQDDLPRESLLEETYYHRLNPPRASPSSASIPTTARSTRRWRSRMAT